MCMIEHEVGLEEEMDRCSCIFGIQLLGMVNGLT